MPVACNRQLAPLPALAGCAPKGLKDCFHTILMLVCTLGRLIENSQPLLPLHERESGCDGFVGYVVIPIDGTTHISNTQNQLPQPAICFIAPSVYLFKHIKRYRWGGWFESELWFHPRKPLEVICRVHRKQTAIIKTMCGSKTKHLGEL